MSDTLTSVVLIVGLLAANAFFVAAEFALVKVRRMRLEAMAEQGSRVAAATLHIKQHLEPYLAACQLGITMASLGLGWVGEPFVAALLDPAFRALGLGDAALHTTSFLVGFVLFSSLHIVIGEQVPKTLAIRKPEPVSLGSAWVLRGFYLLAWPLNAALNGTSRAILRVLGVAEAGHDEVFSGEEISQMVATSSEHGVLEGNRADMIRNLLDFDRRTVRDVMTPRQQVDRVDLGCSPEQLWALVRDTGHSRFPVFRGDGDEIVGLLLVKDLFGAAVDDPARAVERLPELVRPALIVPDSVLIGPLFAAMKARRSHMAVVVDEFGTFCGIATLEDLLEEIVGEIDDELDDHRANLAVRERDSGGWQTTGLTAIHEMDRALGSRLADTTRASSVSGFLVDRLGRLPAVGDAVVEAGLRFTVRTIEGRRAGVVDIVRDAGEPPAAGTAE